MEIPISSFKDIPVIELSVNNNDLRFFLDSGAKLSYLPEDFLSAYISSGTREDFYPLIGKFRTECFRINTSLVNENFEVTYGILPEAIQTLLSYKHADGIIGYDFFNNFKVMLDLMHNRLRFKRHIH
ncbi:MAG TPA: hypothetical protein PKA90_16470 [Ignavibacteria bacterium]|nr:hypothetical protein [Ignavibacteria bacterium]HMR42013.1 hypothetical protein [Ignavibacteria bacterium]